MADALSERAVSVCTRQLVSGFNFILWIAAIVIFLSWKPIGQLQGGIPAIINAEVAAVLVIVILVSAVFNFYRHLQSQTRMESST
jgi:sodium/potassium-transporting ATPase subunit alpha